MTWVTLGLMLTSGLGLMILSWNGTISHSPSPGLMILFWAAMSGSGIYLFMLAVKKAHRLWIDDERRKKEAEELERKSSTRSGSSSKENKALDVASTARKLVRRIPEEVPLVKSGPELLKALASELEIMSGILYIRDRGEFRAVATYALTSPSEPFTFKEGEGLTGQVAANQQTMVLTRLPEGHRMVYSGLGKLEPSYLAIVPLIHRKRTIGVLECSGYRFDPADIEAMFRLFARDLMEKLSPSMK